MSNTQAERVDALMPEVGRTLSPGEACEPEDVRSVITSLVAENEALRADAGRLADALDHLADVASLCDSWQSFPPDELRTAYAAVEDYRAARNTTQQQGG